MASDKKVRPHGRPSGSHPAYR